MQQWGLTEVFACFRGAIVKALAIVTHHPFIQIFKVMQLNISLNSAKLLYC